MVMIISSHGYRNILALGRKNSSSLLAFPDDAVEQSPIVWDEFRATTC